MAGGEMESTSAKVLLVDEIASDTSELVTYLKHLGCLCALSRSVQQACTLVVREQFDLVLSRFELPGDNCHALSTLLMGRRATLFYFYAVEGGCWWIPRIYHGQECEGEPALHPREFAQVLEGLIAGFRATGKQVLRH
jgi:hypothetical protein